MKKTTAKKNNLMSLEGGNERVSFSLLQDSVFHCLKTNSKLVKIKNAIISDDNRKKTIERGIVRFEDKKGK